MLDGIKRLRNIRLVVHGQKNAGCYLQHQYEAGQKSEIPPVVEIARRRIAGQLILDKTGERKALVYPGNDTFCHNEFLFGLMRRQ